MKEIERHPEHQYLDLMRDILENGSITHEFNSGIEIKSVFGRQIRFNLEEGFPLLTTKKVFTRGIIHELLWFLSGSSNIKYLVDNDVHIWDEWAYKIYKEKKEKDGEEYLSQDDFIVKMKEDGGFADEWGDILTVYGRMWRRWPASDGHEIDQLTWAIEKLKQNPDRKHYVVSAWNPDFIYEMASPENRRPVPPFCHTMFQFRVLDNKLSCHLYQRSSDLFLGVPFNIASYALLTMMMAQVTGYGVGDFVHTFGDVHLYGNHYEQAKEQMSREPRPFPTMKLNPSINNIDNFKYEDFTLVGYDPHPPIKGDITVVGGIDEKAGEKIANKVRK